LGVEPVHARDLFVDFHAPEGIELSGVRLELGEVLIAGRAFFGLLGLEDDDAAGFVSNGEVVAGVVELDGADDVFL
jgi:hypothetical protein